MRKGLVLGILIISLFAFMAYAGEPIKENKYLLFYWEEVSVSNTFLLDQDNHILRGSTNLVFNGSDLYYPSMKTEKILKYQQYATIKEVEAFIKSKITQGGYYLNGELKDRIYTSIDIIGLYRIEKEIPIKKLTKIHKWTEEKREERFLGYEIQEGGP